MYVCIINTVDIEKVRIKDILYLDSGVAILLDNNLSLYENCLTSQRSYRDNKQ